jgi:two-component system, OmpR family, sensor kinase
LHNFFTRIFVSFWLAIVLIAAGAAAVTAIDFAAQPDRPATVVRQATDVLNRDGIEGLRVWLAERNRSRPGQRTLIIDSNGKDILGQKLPQLRRMIFSDRRGPPDADRAPREGPPGLAGNEPPLGDRARPGEGPLPGDGPGRPLPGGPPPPDGRAPPFDRGPQGDGRTQPGFMLFRDGGRERGLRWTPSVIQANDGAIYRVIFDPPPRRGPLSPPFSATVRVLLLAVALAVSGLISYLLARSISSPVRRLQAAAHTLSSGNLDARAGPEVTRRKDELGVLGREFDSMAERLGALIAARQSLLRDISHELRSPLARMEMAIGLARQDPSNTSAQLDRVEREAERLDQLIGHILEYARLERDPATFTFEDLDLAELVRQIVHDAEFESQSPPDRLQLVSADTLKFRGDPHVLHSAIDNVVRNALLHGDAQLPIRITLSEEPGVVRIAVRDRGPGVREEDLPHLFEPFYRAGTVDSRRVLTEGTGIGLAITQRAVGLHGGQVSAANAEGGGLIVTIVLPREPRRD